MVKKSRVFIRYMCIYDKIRIIKNVLLFKYFLNTNLVVEFCRLSLLIIEYVGECTIWFYNINFDETFFLYINEKKSICGFYIY